MSVDCIEPAADGFYHPASEEELICLVKRAYHEGLELRVRGSAHSMAHAIYTGPLDTIPNQVEQQSPPKGDNLNVMLDRYTSFRVVDHALKRVECDAGIHLGLDPSDPTHTSTLQNSLLYQLFTDYGWTISDTGGISHQTVSGFTATGSAGGSLQFSANDNLYAFRVIDGTGEIFEVNRDAHPDLFGAFAPNMGLLGVISKITLQCVETLTSWGRMRSRPPRSARSTFSVTAAAGAVGWWIS